MFVVYILYSASLDKYYIGFTAEDVSLRLKKHLAQHSGFTGRVKDWDIVYTEQYFDKIAAMKREKEMKSWKSVRKIKSLVNSTR
jgi:putative endonuclease